MEEKIYLAELFEIYKDLLTDKQREIFGMHYALDFSLSEIAEEKGITRQNASDTVKSVKEKLLWFENTLKIKEKQDELYSVAGATLDAAAAEKIKEIIGR